MAEMNLQRGKLVAIREGAAATPGGKLQKFLVTKEYYELKTRIHDRLLNLIDLSLIDSLDETTLRQEIRKLVERILYEDSDSVP